MKNELEMKAEKIRSILKPQSGYARRDGIYCFDGKVASPDNSAGAGLLGRIQSALKKKGKLYTFLKHLISPVYTSAAFRNNLESLLSTHLNNHVILNVGSGPKRLKDRLDIINTDIFAFGEVDIITNADDLPLIDESVDLLINIAMLEHTVNPEVIVKEMWRVLKSGGLLFCYVPFLVPFHAAPDDYRRWTENGCKQLFSRFQTVDVLVGAGPTSGMLWALQEWLAILFSFGSGTIHDILLLIIMTITSPIKFLDYFLEKHPQAAKISSGFVIVCKK